MQQFQVPLIIFNNCSDRESWHENGCDNGIQGLSAGLGDESFQLVQLRRRAAGIVIVRYDATGVHLHYSRCWAD